MPKTQKPIIQNEKWYPAPVTRRGPAADRNDQWYLSALKLVLPSADREDRRCFPDAPPQGSDRGCLPDAPRPRRSPRPARLPLPDRDGRGCFP